MTANECRSLHGRATRLLHMVIALLVIAQVATSEFMIKPGKNREEDLLFEIHEYTGIVAFFLIFGLWLYAFSRDRGQACCSRGFQAPGASECGGALRLTAGHQLARLR